MCNKCVIKMMSCSLSEDIDIAKKEWFFYDFEKKNSRCICGKNINHVYYLINYNTKIILEFGEECIHNNILFDHFKVSDCLYTLCRKCLVRVRRTDEKKHNKSKRHIKNIW